MVGGRSDGGRGEGFWKGKGRTVEPGHGSGRQGSVKTCLSVVYLSGVRGLWGM